MAMFLTQLLLQASKTLSLVLFYYFFSISLTFYNKWILMVSCARRAMQAQKHLQLMRTNMSVHVFTRHDSAMFFLKRDLQIFLLNVNASFLFLLTNYALSSL